MSYVNGSREWVLQGHGDPLFEVELTSPSFATRRDADREAARFPKSVRARVVECRNGTARGATFSVRVDVQLRADRVNGGYNEAGVKRLRAALRTVPTARPYAVADWDALVGDAAPNYHPSHRVGVAKMHASVVAFLQSIGGAR